MLFDTHFHLDLVQNPEVIAKQIEQQGIYTVAVTNLPGVYSHTEQLCHGLRYLRPALGYHPELVAKYPNQIDVFATLLKRTRYIGEIGLDNLRKQPGDYQRQKEIFKQIIELCALERNKILSVHSRRSERDVTEIIGDSFPGKVILHWFSGSIKQMETAISQGFYFSINTSMTKSENGKRIIEALPIERLLLETDGPFIQSDGQPCLPQVTGQIIEQVGLIRNFSKSEMGKTVWANFTGLLNND